MDQAGSVQTYHQRPHLAGKVRRHISVGERFPITVADEQHIGSIRFQQPQHVDGRHVVFPGKRRHQHPVLGLIQACPDQSGLCFPVLKVSRDSAPQLRVQCVVGEDIDRNGRAVGEVAAHAVDTRGDDVFFHVLRVDSRGHQEIADLVRCGATRGRSEDEVGNRPGANGDKNERHRSGGKEIRQCYRTEKRSCDQYSTDHPRRAAQEG